MITDANMYKDNTPAEPAATPIPGKLNTGNGEVKFAGSHSYHNLIQPPPQATRQQNQSQW